MRLGRIMTDREQRSYRHGWCRRHPGAVRLSRDEATRVWLQSLHPRAIDQIVVCPAKYRSTWGQESPRDKTVAEFARELHPEGGFLKRIPNAAYDDVYLVLAKENRESGQATSDADE